MMKKQVLLLNYTESHNIGLKVAEEGKKKFLTFRKMQLLEITYHVVTYSFKVITGN